MEVIHPILHLKMIDESQNHPNHHRSHHQSHHRSHHQSHHRSHLNQVIDLLIVDVVKVVKRGNRAKVWREDLPSVLNTSSVQVIPVILVIPVIQVVPVLPDHVKV